MTPIPEHVPTPRSASHYDTSGMHHSHDTTHAMGQIKTFLKPEEFKMLMADETGASLIDQFIAHSSGVFARNNTPESRAQNSAMKDDIVQYLEHLKTPVEPAGDMASESMPGFEDITAPKTTSKAILEAIKAKSATESEKGTTLDVSSKKPVDPIEGMEQAEADSAAAAASASSASSDTERAADADSLDAVGSDDYGAALTEYKNQLLELQKKHPGSDWKGINEDFKKIRNLEELAKHKADVSAYLKSPSSSPITNTPKPGGSKTPKPTPTPTGTPTTSTTPVETPAQIKIREQKEKKEKDDAEAAAKGKGFGIKGMAIGAGLAGVAGYLARGNSGGNSDNDKQLLDMVRGMNPQQLRQILQQIQR